MSNLALLVEFGPVLPDIVELYRLYSVECPEKVRLLPSIEGRSVRVFAILALSSRDSKTPSENHYRLRILRYEVFVYDENGDQDISREMDDWVDSAQMSLDTDLLAGVGMIHSLTAEEIVSMRYLDKRIEVKPDALHPGQRQNDGLYFDELCRQESAHPSIFWYPYQHREKRMSSPRQFFTSRNTGTVVERLNAPSKERGQVVHIHLNLGDDVQATVRMTEEQFDQKFQRHGTLIVDEWVVIDDLDLELTYHEAVPRGFGPQNPETRALRVPLSQIVGAFRDQEQE